MMRLLIAALALVASPAFAGQATLTRGFLYPNFPITVFAACGSMGASGLRSAFVGRVWIEGQAASKTISAAGGGSIGYRAGGGTVFSNGSTTIEIGIQDLAAGGNPTQPDGTFDVSRVLTGGVDTITAGAWNTISMTGGSGSKTISQGDLIAVVFHVTGYGGSDLLQNSGVDGVRGMYPGVTGQSQSPGCVNYNGATWANGGSIPAVAITFDDGTIGTLDFSWPYEASAGLQTAYADSSNPDEYGMAFQIPFAATVDAVYFSGSISSLTTSDFTIEINLDPTGTPSSVASVNVTAETVGLLAFGSGIFGITLPTTFTLNANTTYSVSIKATGAGALAMNYTTIGSAALRPLFPAGATAFAVTRNGGSGAFTAESPAITNYAIGVRVLGVPDGVGGGQGIIGGGL